MIELPKKAAAQPKQIKVNTTGSANQPKQVEGSAQSATTEQKAA